MTRDQFLAALEAEYAKCVAISRKKNADYGADTDPFRNFRAAEHLGIRPDKAILVRMSDKMARIANLLDNPPAVVEESIEDTLRDNANYSIILLLLVREMRQKAISQARSIPSVKENIGRLVPRDPPPVEWEDSADPKRFDVI